MQEADGTKQRLVPASGGSDVLEPENHVDAKAPLGRASPVTNFSAGVSGHLHSMTSMLDLA